MSSGALVGPRQIELLYAISRELVSHLALPDVLAGVLRITVDTVDADTGSIALLDEHEKIVDGVLLVDGRLVPDVHEQLLPMVEEGLIGWGIRERKNMVVHDTISDPRWSVRDTDGTSRSAISVLIRGEGERLLGVVTLVKNAPNHFESDDETLLKAIAQLASVAITNAQLYAESQRQTDTMAALAETSRIINSTLDPKRVIRFLLERTVSMMGARAASIALLSPDGTQLIFEAAAGEAAEAVIGMKLELGQGIAGWVAKTGRSVLAPDTATDERFFAGVDDQTGYHTRAILCVPIQAQGFILGVIEAINPERGYFNDNDLQLLSNIANLAGNALVHAQEYTMVEADRDRYAELFEDSVNMILISDLNGKIVDANRKTLNKLGYSRLELLDKSILALHGLKSNHLKRLVEGEELTLESSIVSSDQRVIPVEVGAKRIQVDDTMLIQWTERDVSERRQMEAFRTDLTAMLFHDLRSPLGNVISSLDLLRNISDPGSPAISIADLALRSARRLSRLIDSLLDLTRLESGRVLLQLEVTDLNTLITESIEQVQALAEGKKIALSLGHIDKLPELAIDADMIQRVLINLIENAVKYTRSGGKVDVSAGVVDDEVVITIKDTGIGVPKSEQKNIFHKFARVRRKNAPKGLGLGLSFCKLAVEAHDGRIWVISEEGQGSTFSIAFPVSQA